MKNFFVYSDDGRLVSNSPKSPNGKLITECQRFAISWKPVESSKLEESRVVSSSRSIQTYGIECESCSSMFRWSSFASSAEARLLHYRWYLKLFQIRFKNSLYLRETSWFAIFKYKSSHLTVSTFHASHLSFGFHAAIAFTFKPQTAEETFTYTSRILGDTNKQNRAEELNTFILSRCAVWKQHIPEHCVITCINEYK